MRKLIFNSKGFTLIEFLTVVVVIASIGLIIVGILTSALRGTNKTNIVNLVRQSGNQAVVQMARMIEYAQGFDGVSMDGNSYTVNCVQGVLAPTPTPPPTQYKYLKITAFDGGKIIYSCISNYIASNSASLIDTNSVKMVPNKCWFTCTQERVTSNPIIGIKFQLMQSAPTGGFVESKASIPFETSITFKNLIK
jgi:prepilin-type N-terminal cleavage/methylation domain-containing protein